GRLPWRVRLRYRRGLVRRSQRRGGGGRRRSHLPGGGAEHHPRRRCRQSRAVYRYADGDGLAPPAFSVAARQPVERERSRSGPPCQPCLISVLLTSILKSSSPSASNRSRYASGIAT